MAVTANQLLRMRNAGCRVAGPVSASKRLYQATLCFADASAGTITDVTNSGANHFFGVVVEECDNSSGSAGDKKVEVYQEGEFELVGSSLTQAMVGDKIYASDNYTITTTSTNNTLIGRVTEYISATKLMVRIEPGVQA